MYLFSIHYLAVLYVPDVSCLKTTLHKKSGTDRTFIFFFKKKITNVKKK